MDQSAVSFMFGFLTAALTLTFLMWKRIANPSRFYLCLFGAQYVAVVLGVSVCIPGVSWLSMGGGVLLAVGAWALQLVAVKATARKVLLDNPPQVVVVPLDPERANEMLKCCEERGITPFVESPEWSAICREYILGSSHLKFTLPAAV